MNARIMLISLCLPLAVAAQEVALRSPSGYWMVRMDPAKSEIRHLALPALRGSAS